MKFSVLICVYERENPDYLKQALKSVLDQTLMPDEIVLVKDGALTAGLNEIISGFEQENPGLFKIIPIEENVGLGKALATGVENCAYELVARMDSDDVADPERFKKQVEFMKANPDTDVVGSFISEFSESPEYIYAYRKLPVKHEDIYKFGKWRCPMNHMTVIFRKASVLNAGNYSDLRKMQDFELWGRMLNKGYKFANIPENLVNVRGGKIFSAKRQGAEYFFSYEMQVQIKFLKNRFINIREFLRNVSLKFLLRIIPVSMREFIYGRFLRG